MRKDIARYTTTLVRDADYYMLWSFADCDLDGRWGLRACMSFYYRLNAVSKKLANYVFEMGENVWESC